jgi:hypothetical protein
MALYLLVDVIRREYVVLWLADADIPDEDKLLAL